jgi:hypothetical protein
MKSCLPRVFSSNTLGSEKTRKFEPPRRPVKHATLRLRLFHKAGKVRKVKDAKQRYCPKPGHGFGQGCLFICRYPANEKNPAFLGDLGALSEAGGSNIFFLGCGHSPR